MSYLIVTGCGAVVVDVGGIVVADPLFPTGALGVADPLFPELVLG